MFIETCKLVMILSRFLGSRVFINVDDNLFIASSFKECKNKNFAIIQILKDFDFLINKEKSQIHPVTAIQYLRFVRNSFIIKLFLAVVEMNTVISTCNQPLACPNSYLLELSFG